MNSEQEDEHFASLSAGCASQQKLNRIQKLAQKNTLFTFYTYSA